MQLNLPINHLLKDAKRVLIAGAGGGFDVFAGLPLYFTLFEQGFDVHLANLTFTELDTAGELAETKHSLVDSLLLGVQGNVKMTVPYFPEGYLSQWFRQVRDEEVIVWMMARRGVVPLTTAYRELVTHLGGVDALILVDGGVDALMRGDEQGAGTILEDSMTLAAIQTLDVPVKVLANIGFGSEVEEAVCHHHALQNMAELAAEGAFYGACALTPQMDAFQQYEAACRYVWEQPMHHKSHISTRIIPAVNGQFGNIHMYPDYQSIVLISPLMSLYWFFDAEAVARRNLLIDALNDTMTHEDAFRLVMAERLKLNLRPRRTIPY